MLNDDIVVVYMILILTLMQSGPVCSSPSGSLDYFECFASALLGVSSWDRQRKLHIEKGEVAKFVQGYEGVASGRLVHVSNEPNDTGCSLPWANGPLGSRDLSPWIALVRRGGCSFQTKIDNAQMSNASGIVVYNFHKTSQLAAPRSQRRTSSLSSSTIVAVFTYNWKGEELVQLLKEHSDVHVYLSIANPCIEVETFDDVDVTTSKMICTLFVAILLVFIFFSCTFLYAVQKHQSKTKMGHTSFYTKDERALAKIPKKALTSTDKIVNNEAECCAVCIDSYETGDIVRTLTCGHEFHDSCIDPWLLIHRTCPMCKIDILKIYGSVFAGSQESILHVVEEEIHRRMSVVHITIEEEIGQAEDEESTSEPVPRTEHPTLATDDSSLSCKGAQNSEKEVSEPAGDQSES